MEYTPAIIMTDTSIPPEVESDVQLGRRTAVVHLTERVEWEPTLNMYRINPSKFRLHSTETARACDEIMSEVIDEYFAKDSPPFREIVKHLGFRMMRDSEVRSESELLLKELYNAWEQHPAMTVQERNRFRGNGWKTLYRESQANPFKTLWEQVHDTDDFGNSRQCESFDWSTITGKPTKFELRGSRNTVAVRFTYE
jgi:hypothetical protein